MLKDGSPAARARLAENRETVTWSLQMSVLTGGGARCPRVPGPTTGSGSSNI